VGHHTAQPLESIARTNANTHSPQKRNPLEFLIVAIPFTKDPVMPSLCVQSALNSMGAACDSRGEASFLLNLGRCDTHDPTSGRGSKLHTTTSLWNCPTNSVAISMPMPCELRNRDVPWLATGGQANRKQDSSRLSVVGSQWPVAHPFVTRVHL
jgi:hypothetical protein